MWFDDYLQRRRFDAAKAFIQPGSKLLDVGCRHGELFRYLENIGVHGTGVDPEVPDNPGGLPDNVSLLKSRFPASEISDRDFDGIAALAVFEHIPTGEQDTFARSCYDLLKDQGIVIITVPSPLVDYINHTIRFFRLMDAYSLEQHYGFKPKHTPGIFEKAGFEKILHKRFELGLNNIFVFRKKKQSH